MKKILILLFSLSFMLVMPNLKAIDNSIVYTDEDYERLHAVITHVENILKYGGRVQPDVPILPDGINTLTGGPVIWTYPNRSVVAISNFANQQNFLRSLVALSQVTSDAKYANIAKDITSYYIDNYTAQNGLFLWGGHVFVNLFNLQVQSAEGQTAPHELKNHLPYYELMYDVRPDETTKFLQQMWTAHIVDWNGLDMNRHGSYASSFNPNVFTQPIPSEDVVDVSKLPTMPLATGSYLPFINAGTDLAYAAYNLYERSGDRLAKDWADYLMRQYHVASNPTTKMTVYQFKSTPVTKPALECADPSYTNSGCGDRAARQFRDFGAIAQEGNVAWKNTQSVYVDGVLTRLLIGEKFKQQQYVEWSRGYLEAFLDHTYIVADGKNMIIPMFNDGTLVYGYIFPEVGYFGPAGTQLGLIPMPTTYLLPILRTIHQTEKEEDQLKLWMYLRKLATNFNMGDLGPLGGAEPKLNLDAAVDDPYCLIMMIDLYQKTQNKQYLDMARRIGTNIINAKFRRGFILDNELSLYARLDSPSLLALITLDAVIRGKDMTKIPYYVADAGYIHGYMLNSDGVTEDRSYTYRLIYTKTIYDKE